MEFRRVLFRSSSFVNGPYTSAVSKNVTPRSTAARRRVVISCLSLGGPYEKLIPMQPTPGLKLPGCSFLICASPLLLLWNCFPHRQVRLKLHGSGISILPIYCLFLLYR